MADSVRLAELRRAPGRLVDLLHQARAAWVGDVVDQEATRPQAAVGREHDHEIAVDHQPDVAAVSLAAGPGWRDVAIAGAGGAFGLRHPDRLEQLGLGVGQVAQAGAASRLAGGQRRHRCQRARAGDGRVGQEGRQQGQQRHRCSSEFHRSSRRCTVSRLIAARPSAPGPGGPRPSAPTAVCLPRACLRARLGRCLRSPRPWPRRWC
jgi:hypothetical protein